MTPDYKKYPTDCPHCGQPRMSAASGCAGLHARVLAGKANSPVNEFDDIEMRH